MSSANNRDSQGVDVVEGLPLGRRMRRSGPERSVSYRFRVFVAAVLFGVLWTVCPSPSWLGGAPPAYAAEPSSSSSSASTGQTQDPEALGNVTDTQNLLGDRLPAVNDAIKHVKQATGVTVRLLYLDTFSEVSDPEQWASDVLESTDPAANTVLLAVASNDGNLVVAVSANSDEWLKRQQTVDKLSDSALKPLVAQENPDWAGSALAMMEQIPKEQSTSSTGSQIIVGAVVFVGALAVLLVIAVVIGMRRKKATRHGRKDGRRDRRRRSKGRANDGRAPDGHGGRRSRHSRAPKLRGSPASEVPTVQSSDGIQKTSSESGDAGEHE